MTDAKKECFQACINVFHWLLRQPSLREQIYTAKELADAIQQCVTQAEQREAMVDGVLTFYLPLPASMQQVAPQCIAFL